ncbi:MAG: PilZ domain-containing protein [Arenicella sp.]
MSESIAASADVRPSVISISIKDKQALYMAYMPFITNGGLFIPSAKNYKIDDEVFLLLKVMDEPDKIPIAGRVVWVTPENAQDNRSKGVGIQFNDEDAGMIVNMIETKLGASLKSQRRTHTM